MAFNRLLSLKKTLTFNRNYCHFFRLYLKNDLKLNSNQLKRCVHSSNTHEIDFLFNKYKLSKISGGQSYGRKSSVLHHFNTIEDFTFASEKDQIVETLRRVLDISKTDANNLVKNYPNLVEMSSEKLEKQVMVLSERFGLNVDHYLSCPWILYLPINFITERLNPFGAKPIENDYLVLLLLPFSTFEFNLKKIKKNNFKKNVFQEFSQKLNLFTSELHLIDEEFCDLIHENLFLFYYDFEKLQNVMNVMLSAGIESDTIVSDIKIFTHNIELMKKRIAICFEHNMPVKTWMLRSPEEPFEVSLRRHLENKIVLKDNENSIEYMANHLKCQKDDIHSMMKRYPRIVRISAIKLSKMLSILVKNGFTSYHIVETPKILFHSVETILKRIRELKKLQIKPNSLKILTLSQTEYNKLLEQFKQINGN